MVKRCVFDCICILRRNPLSAVDVSLSQGLFKKISMHLLEAEVLEPLLAPWPTGAGRRCLGKSRLLPFPATILLKDFYQQKQHCRDRHQWWLFIRAKGTQNPRFAEDLLGSHHDDCLGLGGSHLTATAFDKVSVKTVALWMRRSAYQDYQRDWDVLSQSKAFQELFSSFGSKASCMVMITTTTPLGSSNASRALCILASTEKTGTAILERGFGPAPFIQY